MAQEDYFGDGGPAAGTAAPQAAPPPADQKGAGAQEEKGGKTFLINKEVCPGMNVGEEMVVKIEAVHDDEYEVSYAPEPKEEGGEGRGMEMAGGVVSAPEAPPPGGSMAGMY